MERWHGTMLVIGVSVFGVLFKIFLAKRLPFVEILLLVIYVLGVFAIVIPLCTGTAVMIGMSGTIASLAGFDCAVHMCK